MLLPTKSDPWGSVLIEGIAAGLPILTSGVAGAADIVRDHGAGVVIEDPTPDVLRAGLRAMFADPQGMARMAEAGRGVATELSVEQHAAATLKTYERIERISGHTRPLNFARPAVPRRRRIATLPPMGGMNPYQRLLYEHLRPLGYALVPGARLRSSWLRAARPDVDIIHIHWPQSLYMYVGGGRLKRTLLSGSSSRHSSCVCA